MKKLGFRIWLLIIFVIISLISIIGIPFQFLERGVLITEIEEGSLAFEQGLRTGQTIIEINGNSIRNIEDYVLQFQEFPLSQEEKLVIRTKEKEFILFTKEIPEINIGEIPKTNLKFGLDISGGSRALVKAKDVTMTSEELEDLVEITKNRFNEFGLEDMKVVSVSDLSGERYMLIEIAGATTADLERLISEQGVFEARIGNETVFEGGKDKGIASIVRSGQSAGIYSCNVDGSGQHFCNFRFGVYLTPAAAQRQADITSRLDISLENREYLSEPLDLVLDGRVVNSLQISTGLKGNPTTQISISGVGQGSTRQDAYINAEANMKQLQTVLITGSLPFELEIVKLDTISPRLGNDFIKAILIAGISALIAIAIVVFFRYKKINSSLALIFTSICEVIIILGIAAFIEWNLDLASIAGVIAGVGTGIDSQIIVLDEAKQKESLSIKEKLKRAFSIIMGSYFTSVVALFPLMWAGAGLFKGFAITTILGITVGVLITRPAFANIIGRFEED